MHAIVDHMLTAHTRTRAYCYAEQRCQLVRSCGSHTQSAHTQLARACTLSCRVVSLAYCIMHGAQGSQASGVWEGGPGASSAVGHMSAQSHRLSADLKHTHTQPRKVHSHTHCSVAWQICTRTHSPMACQTKVNVIRSMSWFHILWISYANATQLKQATSWQIVFQQRSCTACCPALCSCLMPFVLIMWNIHMLSSLITLQVLIGL